MKTSANTVPPLVTAIWRNGFLLSLLCALVMAFLWPQYAGVNSPLRPKSVTRYGAMLIFLLQGLSLPVEQILSGLFRWRLHVFCQTWNFLVAPLIALIFTALASQWLPLELRAGLLYLSFLPTTISSAVILTTSAGGNIPGALFNTSLSNLLGVILSPLWVLIALGGAENKGEGYLAGMLMSLVTLILLPFLTGQILRPFLLPIIQRIKPTFRFISNSIILFMIYVAVSESLLGGVWQEAGLVATVTAALGAIFLLFTISTLVYWSSNRFLTDPEDRVTGFYCGSQKTLGAGIPMATAIFASHPTLSSAVGFIVLPLIIYHPAQLFLGGALVPHFQKLVQSKKDIASS